MDRNKFAEEIKENMKMIWKDKNIIVKLIDDR